MIGMTNARGGKDRLNLRVFGGTTAPSNPKSNDIWVKTSIAIPNYSVYINEANSNFWTGAANGSIYIKFEASGSGTSATTGANIIKYRSGSNLEEFNVNFLGCMQIMNGVWANVEAYIYHNGWHQFSSVWNGELFDNGNQYEGVTGGWVGANRYSPNLTATLEYGTITISTANAVDMSGFSTLKFMGSGNGANSGGAYSAKCKIANESGVEVASLDFQNNGTYAVSVSALSGKYYVRFVATGSRGNKLDISKVWLE